MKLLFNAIKAIGTYFSTPAPSARDRYLAQSANLSDLEARSRRIERYGLDPKFWP
ncbi:MAG TPA: hypothetical protein VFW88_07750 [Burkholderiales bacterium]|nr:hypothetical protein [Burkholderiales bacterium]